MKLKKITKTINNMKLNKIMTTTKRINKIMKISKPKKMTLIVIFFKLYKSIKQKIQTLKIDNNFKRQMVIKKLWQMMIKKIISLYLIQIKQKQLSQNNKILKKNKIILILKKIPSKFQVRQIFIRIKRIHL